MTWKSLVAHLSCSLLLWSAAFPCQAAESAAGASNCSVPPWPTNSDSCPVKKDSPAGCPSCAAQPAQTCFPESPVAWPTECLTSNWGCPPSGSALLPPPPSGPSITQAAWFSTSTLTAKPKVYEVQVRLNEEDGCCASKVALVEGGDAIVPLNIPDKSGSPVRQSMRVHLGKVEGDCVNLELDMVHSVVTAYTPLACTTQEVLHAEQTVHFDTVTGVVLSGKMPEPRCAEVMVSRLKRRVAPPAAKDPCEAAAPMHCPVGPYPPPPCCVAPPPPSCGAAPTHYPVPRPAMPCTTLMTAPTPMACPLTAPTAAPTFNGCPCFPHQIMTYMPMPIPEPVPMYRQPPPGATLVRVPPPPYPPMMGFLDAPRQDPHGHGSLIRIVHESGKAKLKMQSIDGVSSTAVRMKVETGEAGCLRFAAGKKHVHLTGKMWKAVADHVEIFPDGEVVLTGHVKIVSGKVGVGSSVKADHATLDVRYGKIEAIDGGMFSKH